MEFSTTYTLLIIIIISIALYKFIYWFFGPLFVMQNEKQIFKTFKFKQINKKQNINSNQLKPVWQTFPTIESPATKSLSIVFPAYNEEKRITPCLDATINYLQQRSSGSSGQSHKHFTWEIIVVNDGSSDLTAEIVDQYSEQYGSDSIRLLNYTVNQGKGYAVQQGMLHARGCFILFADSDGASEITHLQRLEESIFECYKTCSGKSGDYYECSQFDCIAIGSRAHLQQKAEVERSVFRNFLMHGFHWSVSFIGGVHTIMDTQCGFKMFTRAAVKKTFVHQCIRRWSFDVEILMLAQLQGIQIIEKQIKWQEIDGSKLSPLKAVFNMFRELVLIRLCYVCGIWYKKLK